MDDALVRLQEAVLDLAAKVFWLYNASDFITRDEAMKMIDEFNDEYGLVEDWELIDAQYFDDLTPEDFNDE